ncbi:hypothetical protein MRX96_021022 [Rhipicephalus microplus]
MSLNKNSPPNADKVYTAAVEEVAGRYGKTYTWELKKRVMGMPDADAARIVIDTLGLPISQDYYLYELDRLYKNSLPNSKVMPGPSRSESIKDIKPQASGSNFKPVSYVIFDLDGLLLDTEKLYSADVETVASRFSKNLTWKLKKQVLGFTEADAAHTIVEALGLPLAPDEFMVAVDCIYKEMAPSAKFMPGAERLVRYLHEHAVPMVNATGSTAPLFDLKMTRHHDVLALFHHAVCAGENPEVKRGEPHPDIFLVAASRFDGKPPSEKVLVFEDAVNGMTAGLAAGMQVVMVPDPRIGEEHRRRATTCVTTLLEFKPELFGLPVFDTPAQDPKKLKHTSSGPSLVHHSLTGASLPT